MLIFGGFREVFFTLLAISRLIVFLCIFYTVCPAKNRDASGLWGLIIKNMYSCHVK